MTGKHTPGPWTSLDRVLLEKPYGEPSPYIALSSALAHDEQAQANYRLAISAPELLAAMEPFSAMAGELFARGYNDNDVVMAPFPDAPIRLTFADFRRLRVAIAKAEGR